MQKLNRTIRLLFAFALVLSVGFPAGILGIIFGASDGRTPLLVIGILLTVAGFYVMPLLWVRYADRRGDRQLLGLIEARTGCTVRRLAELTGYDEENIRVRIRRLITAGMLTGFVFRDDILARLTEGEGDPFEAPRICPHCGARMTYADGAFRCEYCGHTEGLV